MQRTRRPLRWLLAATILGGGAALLAPRLRIASDAPETEGEAAPPAARLGPLPVALPDEPPRPARLRGGINTTLSDFEPAAELSGKDAGAETRIAPCEPPPLGDDPWQPSTRVASYQVEMPQGLKPAPSGPAVATPPAPSGQREYHRHRIADGDTLTKLAQRYLGSSQRFLEIFAANRDRLASPDLLPIGVELRIPAGLAPAE